MDNILLVAVSLTLTPTIGLVSLVYGQENEVTFTIVQGSADDAI